MCLIVNLGFGEPCVQVYVAEIMSHVTSGDCIYENCKWASANSTDFFGNLQMGKIQIYVCFPFAPNMWLLSGVKEGFNYLQINMGKKWGRKISLMLFSSYFWEAFVLLANTMQHVLGDMLLLVNFVLTNTPIYRIDIVFRNQSVARHSNDDFESAAKWWEHSLDMIHFLH